MADTAASENELATSTEQEMAVADESPEVIPEEKAAESTEAIEEVKEAASEESSKANNEVEAEEPEEEEYVLKDEAHEEEDGQKEPETNGKADDEESKDEKKENEKEKSEDGSLGSTVAKHYNNIPEAGKEARKQSRIFYLRNFNNWVKSVLINEFMEKAKRLRRRYDEEINVLDIGCGKGGDLLKWQKARVGHVICADIAETSVQQCKDRHESLRKSSRQGYRESRERIFSLECIPADCTKVDLSQKFKTATIPLDLTSCQFAFHYAFESYEQADTMLKNACANLRPGGFFIGTTPDANELIKNLRKAEENSFGNDVYNVEFENKDEFGLFGTKYHFKLQDVVDCPEFLVHFKTVEKLAEKYDMKLVYKKNFRDIFKERNKDYGNLLHKMQALESHPPRKGWSLVSDKEGDYAHIEKPDDGESPAGRTKVVGTLSNAEWEAAGLYMAFAFEKIDHEEIARQEAREKAQKRRASSEKANEDNGPPSKRTRDAEEEGAEKEGTEATQEETKQEDAEAKDGVEATADAEMAANEDAADAATEDNASAAEQPVESEAPAEITPEEASNEQATSEDPAEQANEEEQVEKMEEDQSLEQQEEQVCE